MAGDGTLAVSGSTPTVDDGTSVIDDAVAVGGYTLTSAGGI
jgi:hypothetical protein